ncbi:MAG TPA: DVUA0089 family protein [Phycisphaerales bacterium]|nr:DVUA0089 family protein [Phycisphaerales bacterium]
MRLKVATAFVLCAAAVAQASPRESLTFTNVISDGLENAATNSVITQTLVGGYTVSKVRVVGTLTSVNLATYESEAIFKITPPGGEPVYVQMSGADDEFTTINFDATLYLPAPIANSTGAWEVRFFETYDDAGQDARWDNLTVTLDDEPVGHIEQGDSGDLPATAQVPAGSGTLYTIFGSIGPGIEDLYKIQICDPANFVVTTVGGTGLDTRLFIFDTAGNGVLYNDDYEASATEYYYQSRIHNTGVLTAGEYYVGVSVFQRMARNSTGQDMWLNLPYEAVRAPDGPGAASPLAAWGGTAFETTGEYVLSLTGACFIPTGPVCGPQDFNGDGDSGTDQDIEAFFACLGGSCCDTCYAGGADFNGDGDTGTDQDIESFFRVLGGNPC